MRNRSVIVRVPASTSNLGSGFDTLGLALNLYCKLVIKPAGRRCVRIRSAISDADRISATAMIEEAAAAFFSAVRTPQFGFDVEIHSAIPPARGLGASAAIRVGVLAALARLSDQPMAKDDLLQLAAALEGHPDNASPALFGGFTVSGTVGDVVRCLRFPVASSLGIVALAPDLKISTEAARKLLPKTYSKLDAAHALNRCGLITAAFSSQSYESLEGVFDDRIHQPYREKLLPQLSSVISAGKGAGAFGGFLSGSGSGIICLTTRNRAAVARAMAGQLGSGSVLLLKADNRGLTTRFQ